jgi:hypothetical protein
MPPSTNFQIVRKSQLRAAGPWRIRPFVRAKANQIFFSARAASVFGGARFALVEFEESGRILRFTGVESPEEFAADDLFRLTRQGREAAERHSYTLAAKSLFAHLGFSSNGAAQELKIAAIDREKRSLCVIPPAAAC